MKKTVSLLFALLFLALCLLPSVGMLLAGASPAAANEVLASAPRLSKNGSLNTAFLNDLSDYMADRFFLRQQFITGWNALNATLLRSSTASNIVLGKNGWLYYADTLPDYTRSEPMSSRALWSAAHTVALMQEYAEGQGCDFVFVLCPNKNSLYPENMPALARAAGVSNATRFQALLTTQGVHAPDLFALLSAREETLYFATDSHWNGQGAAAGADAILTALGREGGFVSAGFTPGEPHRGDLYEMLYPAGTATEPDYLPVAGFTFRYVKPIRSGNDLSIETEQPGAEGSLLCFRDSFGIELHPYLAERFASALFSRGSTYDLSLIAQRGAGAVVIELVERNLSYLLRYPPVLPAPERPALPDAAQGVPAAATAADSPLESCVLVTGALPTPAAESAALYLTDGATVWEATPTQAGFAAHLPDTAELPALCLVYDTGTATLACPLQFAE